VERPSARTADDSRTHRWHLRDTLIRLPDGPVVPGAPVHELSPRPRPIGSGLLWFLAPFTVFALLGVLWALASPVFSVPDENAHAVKAIAQVRGQVIGYTLPDVQHIIVDLPPGYEYHPHMMCFASRGEIPASCGVELGDPGGQDTFNTWVGAYNPLYYYLVGWPSLLFDGNASVYAMRIASAVLGAALLAWAFHAAALGRRARWMPLGVAFAAAPMSMYLMGGVNPNGAEVAAAVAVWVGALRLLETFRTPTERPLLSRTWLWVGLTVASVVLVNVRALGPLWLVLIVAACFLASGWNPVKALFTSGASYVWLAIIAVGSLFSVGWTLTGGSLSSQAAATDGPLVNGTFLQGFGHVIRATNDYLQQAIGVFGWMDAYLPVWVYWFLIAAFAVLVVLGLTATARRSVLVLSGVLAASVLVPALVQGYSVHQTGIIWQGRYGLFLYLGITVVAAWLLSRDAPRVDFLATRITWVGTALVSAYGVLAFFVVMVRYVIGSKVALGQMLSAPQWQPPLGWPVLVIGYALVSAGLVVVVGLTAASIARRETSADASEVAAAASGSPRG
jgi:hypothetical protein